MTIVDGLMQELEAEAATTRRVLERIPEDRLGWRPHERSMSLGQLALHVATIPGGVARLSQQSPSPIPDFTPPSPDRAAELIPAFEQSLAAAREVLRSLDEAALAGMWRLVDGEREILAMSVGTMLRTIMLNHWYHHRGQLAVYLRQVGVPVPSIYGPTADENPFAKTRAASATA